jgi:hypothetical protein
MDLAAQPIANAVGAETSTQEERGHGKGYRYHVVYPQLKPEWKPLAQALRASVQKDKKFLLESVEDDTEASTSDYKEPPHELELTFTVARRTADFVSVLGEGDMYLGGAHGAPITETFNLHIADGKLVALRDLFADFPGALAAIAAECRRQLIGRIEGNAADPDGHGERAAQTQASSDWITKGTEPIAKNYQLFLIDGLDGKAIGLTVIFPPYQVSSYADGEQQVEVPAKVFYPFLKMEYRDAFQIDEPPKRGGGRL